MVEIVKNRIIIHLDMDYFFAQIEERENPRFKGKPVVVGADPMGGKGRGVISTCNYAARAFGLHSAMPISKAYALCPQAIYLPVNGDYYAQVSAHIMKLIRKKTGKAAMEQVSIDEAYVDVSFLKSFAKVQTLAQELRKEILGKEKLTCTCGVGPNKMIAKMACQAAKPNGWKVIKPAQCADFIERMDVEKIPGIGEKTAKILRESNLRTVADLRKISEHEMEDLFGSRGKTMYQRVRGMDEEEVVSEHPVKSIGKEYTFEQDTRDPEMLLRVFESLAAQVAQELEDEKLWFRTITVVCRFSGFETHTKSKTLASSSRAGEILRAEAVKLLLRFITQYPKPIRLIGVRVLIASPSGI
ncbi:MAG: hypothetical protein A2748_01040 [Candidatus Wildermuthbacteria bacterium RIFCSPHIGHO2_01_FULL_45_20]|uniref:DNA polymerase IV n=1 Tax=Candidatus Wildermuthbacteria bacterium RIFCSPHIGHO2_02_FULL_45_25 TaxID=1802450 RepID=A0A1G2R303_9BACT|nr:MAG: hypothetical protein A2748_01040 [Candidatus Wildermuthbacteria bacterium RIFCSPHIGHO2_01_FULL_45_20]OHA66461.1 MAG: hypothetical protein A3C04_01415 [Candidatus Wildermuthbacteria bacterium RIFCSPHIGHO2_02_FULL_45_25]